MPSSNWVLALLLPPNQLVALPWAKCRSTSRGCTSPRARTKSSTAWAWAQRLAGHSVRAVRGCIRAWVARGQEAVVDEEVFLDAQPRVAALQVTGPVAGHAVAQRQVLGPRRGADRVGLHKTQAPDGLRQAGRPPQAAGDGVAAELVEAGGFGRGHARLNHGAPP